jgi:hypothetical protein
MVRHSTLGLLKIGKNKFCIDISDLTDGGKRCAFGQIYKDSIDQGCILISHVTSNEVRMIVNTIQKDAEGDVVFWELSIDRDDAQLYGIDPSFTVIVWND